MFEYSAICDFVMMNLASVLALAVGLNSILALAVGLNSNLLNFVPLKWHFGFFLPSMIRKCLTLYRKI